jgi:hypothetical protein
MNVAAWLARAAGIGHEMASRIDRAEWHWERPTVLVVGLILLVPVSWWIVRRHRERMPWLSRRARRALDVCRIAVLALLVFVLAGPFLKLDERIEERPVVALVVDASESMDLPVGPLPATAIRDTAAAAGFTPPAEDDAAGGAAMADQLAGLTRRSLVDAVLAANATTTLRQLSDRFDLRWYSVARRPRRTEQAALVREPATSGDAAPPAAPEDDRYDTALGEALELAMDEASGRALAAVVLLSDGRSTVGIDPLDAVRRAADAAGGQSRAPVLAVPIGSFDPPDDLAVADVLVAPEVALDDSVTVNATLEAAGFAGLEVPVELRDGEGTVLATQRVTVRGPRQRIALPWKATRPGTNVLTVAATIEPTEVITENNAVTVTVEVSTRRVRVLVVDHAPRWDVRFIDHAIRRDTTFEPEIVLTDSDEDDPTDVLPRDADAWATFDLVMLGDVPPDVLDEDRQAALVEAVTRRGVGVVFQPGHEHLPRGYVRAPLAELFPVTVDVEADGGAATVSAADAQPFRMLVTARGAMHPAFALEADPTRNRARWNTMAPFFRAAAVSVPKPAATTLAEIDVPGGRGRMPLVVEAPAGAGRVAWVGTDETFRWRRNVGDAFFWRFWGQALRGVARREDRPADTPWLAVTPARTEPGVPVVVELNLVDDAGQPVVADGQQVTVSGADADTVVDLRPAGRPGLYAGSIALDALGRHVVRHLAPESTLGGEVMVAAPIRERARPGVDRDGLESLADLSGGSVVEVGDIGSIPYRITQEPIEKGVVLEDEVWDTWPVLALLVGLYCLDIGIRRLSGSN